MKSYLTRLIQGSDNIEITLKDFRSFYQKYCKSDHFIDEVKKPCLEYFEYKCFVCGEKAITAHHSKIGYLYLWHEEIPKHVIAVCLGCHAILHDKIKPFSKKPKIANGIKQNIDFEKLASMANIGKNNVLELIKDIDVDSMAIERMVRKVNYNRPPIVDSRYQKA